MFRGLAGDFRLAFRSLLATLPVSLAAALTLALGIGATTAVFSVTNGLLLRPLPVQNPAQLFTITSETALRYGFQGGAGWNYAMWDRLQPRATAFGGAFAWTFVRLDLSEGGESQFVNALVGSGGFFGTLGVAGINGRMFTGADDRPGGGPDGAIAVISYDLWRRRFGAKTDVAGSRLLVEGTPVTIVGVAPRGFRGPDVGQPFDIAMPFSTEAVIRGRRSLTVNQRVLLLTVMLRLKPGQDREEAETVLRTMQPEILGSEAPAFLREPFVLVSASRGISDRSRLRQKYEHPLVILSAISGIVLLIVCLNISNLLLARATARGHELSLRVAVGAPRWRLARQLFAEGLALGIAGVLAGTLVGALGSRALVAQLPALEGPVLIDLPIDWRVLSFTSAAALLSVVVFSAGPAFRASRIPPIQVLRAGQRSSGGGAGLPSGGLVLIQVALSVVLLAGAGLFLTTLDRLSNVRLGFDPERMLVVVVNEPRSLAGPSMRMQLCQRALDAAAAVPGVTHVAGSRWAPVGTGAGGLLIDARGRQAEPERRVGYNLVTPGWFATYGTALHRGRDFNQGDGEGAPRVAVINEALRRRLLPDRDPVGNTVYAGPCGGAGCTVVGLVADTVYGRSLRDEPPPVVYVPLAQSAGDAPAPRFLISLRTALDARQIADGLAAALRGIDPGLTFSLRPLARDLEASVAEERLLARLAGFFGGLALLLSSVGLYGVASYGVTRRRAEIGIRLALGGQPRRLLAVLLRRTALLVLAGTLAGLLATAWLSRFVAPLLFGLGPHDPFTLIAATVILLVVAAIAAWIPARQALRVDPAQVLREN
jgi:predicted permease